MPRKCVFGCETNGIPFHVFPNPTKKPEQFRSWVNSVGGKLETPEDYDNFRNKRVCDLHFKDSDRNRYNRINNLAVPTSITYDVIPKSKVSQKDIARQTEPEESTSCDIPESINSPKSIVNELEPAPISCVHVQTEFLNVTSQPTSVPSKSGTCHVPVTREHNYCRPEQSNRVRKSNLSKILPQQQKAVYKNLKNKIYRLKKNEATLKSKLRRKENPGTLLLKIAQNMSKPAQTFINMQLKGCSMKSKGRRFDLNEKVMSMSLYKRSAKCYSFLSQYFVLPSPKTVKRLLAEVKIEPAKQKLYLTTLERLQMTRN